MKIRRSVWRGLALLLVVIGIIAALFPLGFLTVSSKARRAVGATRESLRKEGFKTDLSDFDFRVPPEQRGFDQSMNWMQSARIPRNPFEPAKLMLPALSNSAMIAWKEDLVKLDTQEVTWEEFKSSSETENSNYLAPRTEALSHPIRFSLQANAGMAMLLPHLSALKRIASASSSQMLVDLHDGHRQEAWTNLLVTTRLVTAWNPEPVEISHLVRIALASMAYDATWQALQAHDWSENQLAALNREWQGVNFFKDLPDTVAFKRAGAVDVCQTSRKQPGITVGALFQGIWQSPAYAPGMIRQYWSQLDYLTHGSYEDEKAVLLFYRDREIEIRQAVQAPNWTAMSSMPGVTNEPHFISKYRSPLQTRMNMQQMSIGLTRQGATLLGRAAEAEARRRLILAAITLERFRIRNGVYPKTLQELAPELLAEAPTDFMDGKPLRYKLAGDTAFVMYSIGLDCVDNGGQMPPPRSSDRFSSERPRSLVSSPRALDIVWPRPASSSEIIVVHKQEREERVQEFERSVEMESRQYWDWTARRQANAEKILAAPQSPVEERNYNGERLSEVLRNPNASGTNHLTLAEMLTLHQIITGSEPERITFEVPINYDSLTNFAGLALYIDPVADDPSEEDFNPGRTEYSRGTNGDCLLVWNTIFDTPGKHALMLGIESNGPTPIWRGGIVGPPSAFYVSNLCQFSISAATFNPTVGADFHARLPEMRANYSIDMLTNGVRIKTLTGNTSNGEINAFWDLIDDQNQKLTNESFDTLVHLSLPESGRSQTLKGP